MESHPTEQMNIYFKINYQTNFGDSVYLLGDAKELGQWRITQGIKMTWN